MLLPPVNSGFALHCRQTGPNHVAARLQLALEHVRELPMNCLIASAAALQSQANMPPSPFMAEGVGPAADHSAGDAAGRLRERRLSSEQPFVHSSPVKWAACSALVPCQASNFPCKPALSNELCPVRQAA